MGSYRRKAKYRKPPSLSQRLVTIAFIVLLSFGLLSAAFLFFFRGYVIDSANGPVFTAPFFAKSGTSSKEVFSETDALHLPNQESSSPELFNPLHAISLPQEAILNGTAAEKVADAQGNSALFDMRGEDGRLFYVSQLSSAIQSGASSALPNLNDAIRSMNQDSDLYTIAKVSCFPDTRLTSLNPTLALTRPYGSLWLDSTGTAWLSPQSDAVQAYLLDICRELSALGFDEILLTNSAYPPLYAEDTTAWVEAGASFSRTSVLEDFYAEVRHTLDELDVRLSILWETPPVSDEAIAENGQSLPSIASSAHRVWCYGSDEVLRSLSSSHGLPSRFFSIVSLLPYNGNSASSWAIF